MSFRGTREHLEDILHSIHLIEEFTRNVSMIGYANDLKLRAAVERHVEIIAEAAYRLGEETSKVDPGHNWKALRALGNLLRHAYHRIDNQMMWDVVKKDLPQLKVSAAAFLAGLPEED